MLARSVLVLYPTVEEWRSALDRQAGREALIPSIPTGGLSNVRLSIVPSFDPPSEIEIYFAVCGDQAKEIKAKARKLIKDIRPTLVILPGIVGGSPDLGIGDVILSDEIIYPEREKYGVDSIKGRYPRIPGGGLAKVIDTTLIGSDVRQALLPITKRATSFDDAEIGAAAKNAGVETRDLANAVSKAKLHFQKIAAEGPGVQRAVVYSDHINWQRGDNPLVRLSPTQPMLYACDMEAGFVAEVMRELGRTDAPLLIKVVSDIPGRLRSERLKIFARDIAGLTVREVLWHPEFIRLVGTLPLPPSLHRPSSNVASSAAAHLEMELLQPTPNDGVLVAISNQLQKEPGQAPACADLLTHFIEICPRCGYGGDVVFPYCTVLLTSYNALKGSRGEAVRAGQLLNALSILDPALPGAVDDLATDILRQLRTPSSIVSLQRAAYGVLYQLMATNTVKAYEYWSDLRDSGAFSDEALGNWLFTMFSASVSAGVSIESVKGRFKLDWDRYWEAAGKRNPHSPEIMHLIPLLDEMLAPRHEPTAASERQIRRLALIAETRIHG